MTYLPISYILDLIFGDPDWLPHPVRIIGKLISIVERLMRGNRKPWIEKTKGLLFGLLVITLGVLVTHLILLTAGFFSQYLEISMSIIISYTVIAVKDMRVKANEVKFALQHEDLVLARSNLSMIVGRDTENLDDKRIIKATVESISESICDGIVAPLFYLALGGPVLGIAYKIISTLDSMVGYKNEKYQYFGWFSARLDDIVNYIPARITGLLIVLSAFILGENGRKSFKILFRDGKKHPSPNSGFPEAAMAGALEIELGGVSSYAGIKSEKELLGDPIREPDLKNIRDSIRISYTVSFLMLCLGILMEWTI